MRCLPGKDGSFVILPKSTEIFQHLQDVAVNCSTTRVKLIQLDAYINTTRGVVMATPFVYLRIYYYAIPKSRKLPAVRHAAPKRLYAKSPSHYVVPYYPSCPSAAGRLSTSAPGCPNHCNVTAATALVTIKLPVQTSSNVGFAADSTKHRSACPANMD